MRSSLVPLSTPNASPAPSKPCARRGPAGEGWQAGLGAGGPRSAARRRLPAQAGVGTTGTRGHHTNCPKSHGKLESKQNQRSPNRSFAHHDRCWRRVQGPRRSSNPANVWFRTNRVVIPSRAVCRRGGTRISGGLTRSAPEHPAQTKAPAADLRDGRQATAGHHRNAQEVAAGAPGDLVALRATVSAAICRGKYQSHPLMDSLQSTGKLKRARWRGGLGGLLGDCASTVQRSPESEILRLTMARVSRLRRRWHLRRFHQRGTGWSAIHWASVIQVHVRA